MKKIFYFCIPVLSFFFIAGCGGNDGDHKLKPAPFAIYAEYARDSNKLMQPNLNRRVFDSVEAQFGTDIKLETTGSLKGCITLERGTYHIVGSSMVTMQDSLSLPQPKYNDTYPGYALAYPVLYEDSSMNAILTHAVGIGYLSTPYSSTSSVFDCVYTVKEKTTIAVGHQSGSNLHNEVYLSIYDVAGVKSNYHVCARVAITKIGDE